MGVSVKRIVVTGMGIVSPLGCGVQHVWQSLLAGKSGSPDSASSWSRIFLQSGRPGAVH
ncbi:hypothetical protein EAO24_13450 [Klebsiella pneumoniae]|nr:hypothetical protein EAO24_13450 [Klebsiella pneumoniae]